MQRQLKKDQIKNKIVDSLFAKLEEKSLDELTSAEISQIASVSKKTLYEYFSSKTEMYLELVLRSFQELRQLTSHNLEQTSNVDNIDTIQQIGKTYIRFMLENKVKGQLIASYNSELYRKDYLEKVEAIEASANQFAVNRLLDQHFCTNTLDSAFTPNGLFMFLWAYVQGMSALIVNKEAWLKSYFSLEMDSILEEHFLLINKLLRGRILVDEEIL